MHMSAVSEVPGQQFKAGEPREKYEVEERVLWTTHLDMSGYHIAGDKLSGTVITVFRNGSGWTHRLRLDIHWLPRTSCVKVGEPIIVGNISGSALQPLVLK